MPDTPTSDELAARFDERAATYDESAFHRGLAQEVVTFAGAADVKSVLDVATGTGLVLRAIPASRSRRLVGVDVSAGMLAVAAEHLPDAELVRQDAAAPLPFPAASFELITCVTALHLFTDPAAALRGWRGLLAPGGTLVVAAFRTDDALDVPEVAEAVRHGAERHPHGTSPQLHDRIGTPPRVAALAEDAGFRVSRAQTWVHTDPLEVCLLAELTPAEIAD